MKKFNWILTFTFILSLQIYESPANNYLELAATFCHFSEAGLRCSCPEEAKENRIEEKKKSKKTKTARKKRHLHTRLVA